MADIEVKTRGYEEATGKAEKLNKTTRKLGETHRLNEADAKKVGRTQQRILREVETAQEKYNRKVRETKTALAGHAREAELVARKEAQLKEELERSTGGYQKRQAAQKAASDASAAQADRDSRLISELSKKNETAHEKLIRKKKELAALAKRTGLSQTTVTRENIRLTKEFRAETDRLIKKKKGLIPPTKNIATASKGAFNSSRVIGTAAAIGTMTIAARKLWTQLVAIREEQEAAATAQLSTLPSTGKLVQLAGADSGKRDQLFKASDQTFAEGFVATREAADRLIFELESAGRLQDRKFFSRLAIIDDAAALAKSAGLISAGFAGGDDVGTSSQIVSKAIAGALPATGVSPAQIAQGIATAAASAKSFGFTDEELTAAVSRVAQVTGSGEQAGTRLRRLFAALTRKGFADQFKGQGIFSVIQAVESRNLSEVDLTQLLGSVEAVQAFDVLRDQQGLRSRLGDIEAAQRNDLAGQTIDNARGARRISSGVFRRSGEAVNILSREEDSFKVNEDLGLRERGEARARESGQSEFFIGLNRFEEDLGRTFSGPQGLDDNIRALNQLEGPGDWTLSDGERLANYFDRQDAIAEKQAKAAEEQRDETKKQTKALTNLLVGIPVQ